MVLRLAASIVFRATGADHLFGLFAGNPVPARSRRPACGEAAPGNGRDVICAFLVTPDGLRCPCIQAGPRSPARIFCLKQKDDLKASGEESNIFPPERSGRLSLFQTSAAGRPGKEGGFFEAGRQSLSSKIYNSFHKSPL